MDIVPVTRANISLFRKNFGIADRIFELILVRAVRIVASNHASASRRVGRPRKLNVKQALAMTLQAYGTGSHYLQMSKMYGIGQSSIYRHIVRIERLLERIIDIFVGFPGLANMFLCESFRMDKIVD
jgi:hypothetical protein